MSAKKKTENVSSKSENLSQLTYEEYYATLELAHKIRIEKADELAKALEAKEKTKLLEQIFTEYNIPASSSSDPKEREQAILLKANIFIPDSDKFLSDYKNIYDKNIRLISEAYGIPAPLAINKVAELSKFETYYQRFKSEGGIKSESQTVVKKEAEPVSQEVKSSTETSEVKSTSNTSNFKLHDLVTDELSRHLNSMQTYCVGLLTTNQELDSENNELRKSNSRLEADNKIIQEENSSLRQQISSLKSQLNDHSVEDNLRKQIEELKKANAELKNALANQEREAITSHNRATQAAMQLQHFMAQVNNIANEVDTISFGENSAVKTL